MSVYMDVTEQHKAAEEQRQSIATLRVIEAQLTLLVEASSALLASPDSAHVLRTILRLAQQFISAEAYAVWRKKSDGWHLIASAGLSDGYERSIRPNDPAASTMPGRPILIEDVETSDFVRHRLGQYRKEGIRALLAIPLHIRGEVGGTIGFYYRSPRTFDVAEQRIAEALGNLAAAALGTAELYDRQAELRSAAEAAERRSSFLASVGEVLASSLDYETTLASVAKLAVPHFADWCSVDIAEADGSLRCLALEHVDPEKIRFAADFRRRYPPSEDQMSRIVFRTGSSVLVPDISESMLAESARDPEHLRLLRTVGLKSVICAPMRIHGRTLGVITFVTSDSGRGYVSTDLAMAEEIARRAAVAVENARLFKEVSESEERFRRFYDSNMIGVAFWHVDGYITAANDAYLRVMGARREQLQHEGRIRWSSHTPVEYSSVDEQVLQECREFGASATYEKEYVRPDGTRIPVLIAAAFISGSPNDGVAFVLDITDRKRLERQFRGLADAAVQITGASSVEEVLRIASEQARALTEASRASATLSTTTEEADLTVPLKNRSGKTIGAVRVFKESPGEIADSDRAILIQLAEMASIAIENVTLNHFLLQSNEDLRRANEDLNQFAYSASHDLQEPLRMISIYTQLLSRRFGSELDAEAHKFMRYTLDGAQRMEILLRDLLAYTQAVNIRGLPERPVASRQALDRALANLQPLISSSQATINIGDLPPVRAFEVHLVQLFQNLIGNALKYRSAEPPRIDVDARRASPESMWLFRVRDNGIGIDARYHSQIFGLFKRLHSAAEYPGTGIGLAICQKILERYGGTIWVESNQGKGSTFHFTLPV
jgi:PAS domain S-box-containing protein